MKILLTGSSGQLAKEFVRRFEKSGIAFTAPDEQSFDITDKTKIASIVSACKPTHIINCAAYNLVDDAEANREKAFAINRDAVENLALESNKQGAFLIHFGTDYVFDGKKNDLYEESDSPNPLNTYAKSKAEGEKKAETAKRRLILRLSWVTGEGKQNFPHKVRQWAANNKTLKISADEVSVPSFTFDIADACIKALEAGLEGLFHLTNSGYASRYEFAKAYIEYKGLKNIVVPVQSESFKSPAKRPLFTPMSNALISKTLNITVPGWRESLEKYCKEYDN